MSEYDNEDYNDRSSKDKQSEHSEPVPVFSTRTALKRFLTITVAALRLISRAARSAVGLFQSDGQEDGTIKGDVRRAFSNIKFLNMALGIGLFATLLYLLSGIYIVNPGEQAVVKLFGKPVNQGVGEGIHYQVPWPFQTVDIVNVATIRREGVGFMLPEHQSIHSSPEVIQFLTGDNNIVEIQAVVQYQIKDVSAYLYNVNYPGYQLINESIRSAITEMGGGMRVDDILTIGKERLQELIRRKAQGIMDRYGSGLQLVGINLNKVYPPENVAEAFRDVSNAKQDREKRVNDAWGYSNTIIPQARGDAEKLIREAEAYKIAAINKAGGETGRFEQMLAEYENYRRNDTSDVTITRLYLETMEKVLSKVKKYIFTAGDEGALGLRIIQK